METSSEGVASSSSSILLSSETLLACTVRSTAGDEDGSSTRFSSADDAVDGRLDFLLAGFEGRVSRVAGDIVICGAVAVRENEMSFSVSDGTDMDAGTSLDGGQAAFST